MGKNTTKKNAAAVIETTKTELPAPPSEILLDVETTTENEKEETTEMNENKPAKPERAHLVALATEMNEMVLGCAIKTSKSYSMDVITNQILAAAALTVSSDFTPANEGDKVFSHESIETLIALGFEIPQPVAPKKEKATKVKVDKYTWQDATEDAVRTLCIAGATVTQLQAETIKNYGQADVALPGGTFGNFLTALVRFNVVSIDDNKIYKLTALAEEAPINEEIA